MSLGKFATQAVAQFTKTAAVAPSSRHLAEAMVEPLGLESCRVAIELGPGTGVMTRELLRRLPAEGRLFAFELNPDFCQYLTETFDDPRLEVVHACAERAPDELAKRGVREVDAALSSLGLSLMPDELQHDIITSTAGLLSSSGRFTQFQYVIRARMRGAFPEPFCIQPLLRAHFENVSRRVIYRNLPPAFVYSCGRA